MRKIFPILLLAFISLAAADCSTDATCIGNWTMEDGCTIVTDSSANGNDLIQVGSYTLPDQVAGLEGSYACNMSWTGNANTASKLLRATDNAQTSFANSNLTAFSVKMWVKVISYGYQANTYFGRDAGGGIQYLLGELPGYAPNCDGTGGATYEMTEFPYNHTGVTTCYNQSNIAITKGGNYRWTYDPHAWAISKNAWHQVGFVVNSTKIVLYFDGVENASRTLAGNLLNTGTDIAVFGCWYDNGNCGNIGIEPGNFYMDSVQIYNRSLTPTEMLADYTALMGSGGSSSSNHTPSWNDAQTLWNTGIGELFGTNLLIIGAFFLLFAVFISQRMGLPAEVAIPFGVVFIFILTIVNPGLLPGMAWTGLLVLMAFMLFFALRNVFRSA